MTAKELGEKLLALPEDQQRKVVAVHDHSGLAIMVSRFEMREVYLISPHYTRLPLTHVLMME